MLVRRTRVLPCALTLRVDTSVRTVLILECSGSLYLESDDPTTSARTALPVPGSAGSLSHNEVRRYAIKTSSDK